MGLSPSMTQPSTWNLVAPGYAAEIAPTFARFADNALDLARLARGERVLDVATGPGTLSIAAARRGASVSAIDFSRKMIDELEARARREGPLAIDARVADATALPFEDDSFDAVFSMFALNLITDRAAALREIRRVLRREGRAVIGTPASVHKAPAFAAVRDIVGAHIADLAFDGDLPLGELEELRGELLHAEFTMVEAEQVSHRIAYPSLAAMWEASTRAAAPIVLAREQMGEDRWAPTSVAILRDLEAHFGAGPQAIEMTVNLARARK
jgi:SAM-dependent methyltransferase